MAHNCHHNFKLFTAKPNSSRQNQKRSRQNKIAHGKTKKLAAKLKKFTANQKAHGKTKKLTAKPNSSRQNQKARGKTKKLAAKPNSSRQNKKARGKTKWLTAKPKGRGKTKWLTAKPKSSRQNQKARGKTKKAHRKTRKGMSWTLTVLAMVVEKKQDMVALFSRLPCFVLFKLWSGGCLRGEVLCETWSR